MIVKPTQLRPIPSFLLPFTQARTSIQTRFISSQSNRRIPPKIPFCPDVKTFLTLIGRNLVQHADKIKTWRGMFNMRGEQLRKLGIEPPRTRRYLLRRLEQYRQGQYGVGGDLRYVENGVGEVRVVQVSAPRSKATSITLSPGMKKIAVNVISGSVVEGTLPTDPVPVKGVHVRGADRITGSYYQPLKGGAAAKIVVAEGLWEQRRGRKIDGGERRAAENRAKRRGEERRTAR